MAALIQDVRYGFRMFARNPGFTAVVVLTLTLGIGATTIIFTFVNAVVLRPLPYQDSERLVIAVAAPGVGQEFPIHALTPADFVRWEAANRSLEEMSAFAGGTMSLTGAGEPERLLMANVAPRFFETIGVAPLIGRTFAADDFQTGASPAVSASGVSPGTASGVAVISSSLWRRRFQADPSIAGRSMLLDGRPFTIVGVMPDGFAFPQELMFNRLRVDLWVPMALDPNERGNAMLQVVGRLARDVSLQQAQAEGRTIALQPGEKESPLRLVPLHERIAAPIRPLLLLFFGAVGFVLLIACTNVANLLLARATSRAREVAIRGALGSGRWRLVRQFVTESALLGLLSGALGLLAAVWGAEAVRRFIPPGSVPRFEETSIDWQALAFALVVSLVASVLFGLGPALHASTADITTTLKEGAASRRSGSRFLRALVVAEVALAFVLLAGAGLLIKSFARLTSVDPGFEPRRILTVSVTLPDTPYKSSPQLRAFSADVLSRLENLPGVEAAGAINWLPLGGNLLMGDFTVDGIASLPRGVIAAKPAVSPDYFKTMGIPIVQGRAFTSADADGAPGVAIVSARLASLLWSGEDPLGKRLKIGFGRPEDQPWLAVVGVAGDIKQATLAERPRPIIYVPIAQAPRPFLLRSLTFVARAQTDPRGVAAAIRGAIRDVDPDLPFDRVQTMGELLADAVAEPRFRGAALGGFAALALILVATGILGVLAYTVSRRTREIGIRMALGAQRVDVVSLVVKGALGMTAVGLVLGIAGALVLNRLLTRYLFDVAPADVPTLGAASLLLLVVALLASYVPVRRASRVDPLVTLRLE